MGEEVFTCEVDASLDSLNTYVCEEEAGPRPTLVNIVN